MRAQDYPYLSDPTPVALAHRLRTEGAEPVGFEGLIAVVADLIAPLAAFEAAAARFRELRR